MLLQPAMLAHIAFLSGLMATGVALAEQDVLALIRRNFVSIDPSKGHVRSGAKGLDLWIAGGEHTADTLAGAL